MARIYFQIRIDRNAETIVDLPRQVKQLLRKILSRALHERTIVCARREHTQVIQVFVKNKSVHPCELVQVSFGRRFELDVRGQLNFTSLPAFSRYRTSRCSDQSDGPTVRETLRFAPRRGARQQLDNRNFSLLRKDRIGSS